MIIFAAYREWALKSCEMFNADAVIVQNNQDLENIIESQAEDIEAIIFVGWSTIISNDIVDRFMCLCYHPSDLPKYRGGSPIQHQIIDGIEETVGTLFKMNGKLDAGDVYAKVPLCLKGHMEDIFINLTNNASVLIGMFVEEFRSGSKPIFTPQLNSEATVFKRRNKSMSEITLADLGSLPGRVLFNKIRSLEDPYPNAFIKTCDGKRILLKMVEIE